MFRRALCHLAGANPVLAAGAALAPQQSDMAFFHTSRPGYLQNLYEDANLADPFSAVLKYPFENGKIRLMTSAPVSYGSKCKRAPFIIDTGCPFTVVHYETFVKLGVDVPLAKHIRGVRIGTHCFTGNNPVHVNHYGVAPAGHVEYLGYLNLLGLDFLEAAMPGLASYMSENFSKYQPPLSEVVVTDGAGITMPVRPAKPTVMHLKQAIKESLGTHFTGCSALIEIKDPTTGQAMHARQSLGAGTEYVFELPRK